MSNTAQNLYRYLIKPAILGLLVAAAVLIILPYLNQPSMPQQSASKQPMSFADAVNSASPAVVNIYTTQEVRQRPYDPRPRTSLRLGSGVIMDQRGFILTANHVVADVDEIQVALQDSRVFGAQLIGSDRFTDLAVLRIEADNLPVIPQNPDLQSRVGDVVLAIGNPYNLGQTVTQGIISATGRVGLSTGYSDFIQMDAAINEGNSGGALVNANGELVGINNASYQSQLGNRSTTGIYFAVPFALAKRIMQQIINEGVVVRGYLGITAEQHYNSTHEVRGLLITDIDPQGPAARAGIQVGDFIYQIAGKPIRSVNQGLDLVADTRPGSELKILFFRDLRRMETTAQVERLRE